MICIHQLRNETNSNRFLHLLGRFPPQIVREAMQSIKNDLLTNVSLASWVQNETTITARSSQQFFDFILKGTHNYFAIEEKLFWHVDILQVFQSLHSSRFVAFTWVVAKIIISGQRTVTFLYGLLPNPLYSA